MKRALKKSNFWNSKTRIVVNKAYSDFKRKRRLQKPDPFPRPKPADLRSKQKDKPNFQISLSTTLPPVVGALERHTFFQLRKWRKWQLKWYMRLLRFIKRKKIQKNRTLHSPESKQVIRFHHYASDLSTTFHMNFTSPFAKTMEGAIKRVRNIAIAV